MAKYIKSLDMSVFVYDYGHNAPISEHLEKTHQRMFKIIREARINLPIIIMSWPKYSLTADEEKRLKIIKSTYNNALKDCGKNIYLIDGKTLM